MKRQVRASAAAQLSSSSDGTMTDGMSSVTFPFFNGGGKKLRNPVVVSADPAMESLRPAV
jgi:hypothetical protein